MSAHAKCLNICGQALLEPEAFAMV